MQVMQVVSVKAQCCRIDYVCKCHVDKTLVFVCTEYSGLLSWKVGSQVSMFFLIEWMWFSSYLIDSFQFLLLHQAKRVLLGTMGKAQL